MKGNESRQEGQDLKTNNPNKKRNTKILQVISTFFILEETLLIAWVELRILPKHAALHRNTLTHLPESAESGHAWLETCGCAHLYLWEFGLNMGSKDFPFDCSHSLSFSPSLLLCSLLRLSYAAGGSVWGEQPSCPPVSCPYSPILLHTTFWLRALKGGQH